MDVYVPSDDDLPLFDIDNSPAEAGHGDIETPWWSEVDVYVPSDDDLPFFDIDNSPAEAGHGGTEGAE